MMQTLQMYSVIAANLAVIVGMVVGILQLTKFVKYTKADHERRKKQATIEFFHKIDEETNLLVREIQKGGITGVVTVEATQENGDLRRAVVRYLNLMERFCVGMNTGIYDIHVFNRMSGGSVIARFNTLRIYIEHRRKVNQRSRTYGEFEIVVNRLKALREVTPSIPSGDPANLAYDIVPSP